MSTLAKIIAFIMLICAVAFAMTAYVLQQEATNWKTEYGKLEVRKNDEIKKLTDELTTVKANLTQANEERDKWQKAADDLKVKIGERDAEIAKQNGDLKTAQETIKRMEDDIAAIKNDLKTQTANNQTLQTDKEAARVAKEAAEKAQRDAEDKQRILEDEVANLRNQLKLTKSDLKGSQDLTARYEQIYGADGIRLTSATETPLPKINGQVVNADNRSGIVMISVGKDDGVTAGMTFEVSRPAAGEYVGRLRVTEVYNQEAICRIDRPMTPNPIQEGDHVTTRLK